ncbi:hypothetical protein R1sor_023420 [Riccia sorocarpa]|uniref:Uncharacterized protein n=1 Tax=Riccia sorocarpa TaxID=122646 RepID=A0ABD3GTL2_9MARC
MEQVCPVAKGDNFIPVISKASQARRKFGDGKDTAENSNLKAVFEKNLAANPFHTLAGAFDVDMPEESEPAATQEETRDLDEELQHKEVKRIEDLVLPVTEPPENPDNITILSPEEMQRSGSGLAALHGGSDGHQNTSEKQNSTSWGDVVDDMVRAEGELAASVLAKTEPEVEHNETPENSLAKVDEDDELADPAQSSSVEREREAEKEAFPLNLGSDVSEQAASGKAPPSVIFSAKREVDGLVAVGDSQGREPTWRRLLGGRPRHQRGVSPLEELADEVLEPNLGSETIGILGDNINLDPDNLSELGEDEEKPPDIPGVEGESKDDKGVSFSFSKRTGGLHQTGSFLVSTKSKF